MFENYLRVAFRNLSKRKGYAILNILGLAIGMTCCLLIFQYVSFERSYDTFEPDYNNIVRLRLDSYQQGKLAWKSATSYPAFGPTMKMDFPEVEDFCRLHDADILLSNDARNVKFKEPKGYYADASFLNMFGIKLLKGNAATALNSPDKIVLSEATAKKYFGNEDPLGKTLTYRDPEFTRSLEVTGVFKAFPKNSHLIIDDLISYKTLGSILRLQGDTTNATETNFGWYDFYTYIKLKPGTDYKKLEAKFPAYCDKYINNIDWYRTNNVRTEIHPIPLSDIHLYSNYNQEAEVNGNGRSVSFLFMIAFFIIGIAWINYINLSTARSVERAKEVGIRKVAGALRSSLIKQFLIESFMLNLIAFALALVCAYAITPLFNAVSGRETNQVFYLPFNYWAAFIAMFLAGSLLSGIYPAFVLSGFKPISVLKGLFKNSSSGLLLRKSLIVTQFATSVVLIAGTIIVYQQVNYMRSQSLGVNIKQTLVLKGAESVTDSNYQNAYQPFKTELLKIPGVKNVAASSNIVGEEIYWTNGSRQLTPNSKSVTLYNLGIDYDFIPSYNLRLVAGRNFSKDFTSDEKAVLLNEEAARLLGFNDFKKAVGQSFFSAGDTVKLAGIVANYHQEGLQKTIEPMIFRLSLTNRGSYALKIDSKNLPGTVEAVQKIWNKYFPADPFNYFFLDEYFNRQYKADQDFGKVFFVFSFLAIVIACFGLLGLSAYNVIQRAKEISVRKILGASTQNLFYILSKDFLALIVVALVVAIPVCWLIMHSWLQNYAYRINISWWVFAIAGLAALCIALMAISFQSFKAVLANPVKNLRTE